MTKIVVGRAADPGFLQWQNQSRDDAVPVLRHAVLEAASVDEWIGLPPPPSDVRHIRLDAPESKGEQQPEWLVFRPGEWDPSPDEPFACWTSDLAALLIKGA